MKIFTIGFTKKSAETFFTRLQVAGVKRIVDVRLNNVSQLAGFSKKDNLRYFLKVICKMNYVHFPNLAPTKAIREAWTKNGDWKLYERSFLELIRTRRIEETTSPEVLDQSCLLCSEETPDQCHRRLVAEYFRDRWGDVEIVHIL